MVIRQLSKWLERSNLTGDLPSVVWHIFIITYYERSNGSYLWNDWKWYKYHKAFQLMLNAIVCMYFRNLKST